jgi:nucleotide-binding universal stress UspA family protein
MIRNILVPAAGTKADANVFATALAIARPLGAHINFYHLRLSAGEAAIRSPHVHFAMGPAIDDALKQLEADGSRLATAAASHFEQFCATHEVPIRTIPTLDRALSAQWTEEIDQSEEHLLMLSRHHDLVVVGRPHSYRWMPEYVIEILLTGTGRPILIAPDSQPVHTMESVAVCWKETAEAARALTAALPILRTARRVALLCAEEPGVNLDASAELARQLQWHGISAEVRCLPSDGSSVAERLLRAAAEQGAGLLVTGGYGHGPLREQVFGGVTQDLIRAADLPVLMVH